MSIQHSTAAWQMDLHSTEKLVLLCLCDFANRDGICWPSVPTVARRCGVTDRTVQKAIKSLMAADIVSVGWKRGGGRTFNLNPRKFFTPEDSSPPKSMPQGVKDIRGRGERASPKPISNRKESSFAKAAERPLPLDWQPEPFGEGSRCREIVDGWSQVDHAEKLEGFKAYHHARANRFADWQSAWKTWVLNSTRYEASTRPKLSQPADSEAARLAERINARTKNGATYRPLG